MRGLCGVVLGGVLTLAALQFMFGDTPVLVGLQLTLANLGVDLAERQDATRRDRDLLTDLLLHFVFHAPAAVEMPQRRDSSGCTLEPVDTLCAEALVVGIRKRYPLDMLAIDAWRRRSRINRISAQIDVLRAILVVLDFEAVQIVDTLHSPELLLLFHFGHLFGVGVQPESNRH